ncbi:molybdopterin synthase sulfur carrier subunit [Gammaproteobacteria bacterium]
MILVRYFARLREQVDCETERLTGPFATVSEVIEHLRTRGGPWAALAKDPTLLIAINQELARPTSSLHDGDELAFFPPVTGG